MGLLNIADLAEHVTATAAQINSLKSKLLTLLNGNIDDANLKNGAVTAAKLAVSVFESMYPVGSIYISTVATNPNTLFGVGTWVAFGTGRTLVGIDTIQTEFDTISKTGGSKLLAAHTHTITTIPRDGRAWVAPVYGINYSYTDNTTYPHSTGSTGEGDSGNLQPYIVVYMWNRTV